MLNFESERIHNKEAEQIEIEYFTDPLCCWSWAFEPIWRKFIIENKASIKWHYRMAGLIPDWKQYHDPIHDINRIAQMGPYWMQVSRITGAPIDESIWNEDPPQSSYPSCIALKCAELQSLEAADNYLYALREAVMMKRKNIDKQSILVAVAREVERESGKLNADQLEEDLTKAECREMFKKDLFLASYNKLGRFPAFIMKKEGRSGIVLIGYRPYEVFMEAFNSLLDKIKIK